MFALNTSILFDGLEESDNLFKMLLRIYSNQWLQEQLIFTPD